MEPLPATLITELQSFFALLATETGQNYSNRLASLITQAQEDGYSTLKLSQEELTWAGKLAWRNSERCIGRLPWKSLKCLDAQSASRPREVFIKCLEHLDYSTNKGKIIPTITFFPHAHEPNHHRILNSQLIRYAGYREADHTITGDPAQLLLTNLAISLGWLPPSNRTSFDLLPLIIERQDKSLSWFTIPPEFVLEVSIIHPNLSWFEELNLKWHALPAVSNKTCHVAGLEYDCAPFSGYYMGTEIGARNFGDESRYNLLPLIAQKMGLDSTCKFNLWKDRALIELNTAVLYSYKVAGVTIIDHHSASQQFITHQSREAQCGRETPGDWSWLVPPISGSACPVFHQYYPSRTHSPHFA